MEEPRAELVGLEEDSRADERARYPVQEYAEPVASLLTLGDVRGQLRYDYGSLGLGESHIPALARLAVDRYYYWADSDSDEVWGPIHAWRALADFRAEAAIDTLVGAFSLPEERDDDHYDDWIGEELPDVFAAIGPAAVPALAAYLRDPDRRRWARVSAADALARIAERHAETRDEVVAIITEVIAAVTDRPGPTIEDDGIINGSLLSELLTLNTVESAPTIERAFAADRVDPTICGDWEDVQIALGLLAERITPARNYIRERLFGNMPPEDVDRLFEFFNSGTLPGRDPRSPEGAFAALGNPGDYDNFANEPFDSRYPPTPTGPSKERQAELARKAKHKRQMAKQSRKQNRRKK